ncbi:MAG: HAMP domain-containing sensor histidine kinase [Eubacteriales bacterium]|nr:HAMP domain-containing sensor histidine kinase [Eubacteriales bacterium]
MKHKLKTLNVMLVVYMFFVMAFSGALTGVSYLILMNTEFVPYPIVVRYTSPLLVVLVTVMISTTISSFASVRMLRPIASLIKATKSVAEGDFSVRVSANGANNEMGQLVHSFNNMVSELSGIEMFRKDFINNFSHEFKTPIVSIRGFARQLQRDDLSDAQRKEYADIIASESERLAHMASNVLLLTKLENQQIVTDKTEYRLDEQLRSAILLLEKQWTAKDIDLKLNLDEILFTGNEEMVQHVWINLIGNAIKFSNQGGQLVVQCREKDGTAVVEIADNGIGMDEQTRRQIFEKFYQGDTAHATEGNGLGLSLVKRIVDLCGGTISVESTLGQGTFFTVQLPLTERQAA